MEQTSVLRLQIWMSMELTLVLRMAELGNGLTIATMTHSASGTIVGTNAVDNISASSTSASGDTVKFEFNMGEDSANDVLQYAHGAGKELVKITQFDTTSDSLSANVTTVHR